MNDIDDLLFRMIEFDQGDAELIHHFLKVYQYAHLIAEGERIPAAAQRILEATAVMHDIGIKPCLEKYGKCSGKMQEEEGPAYAADMLAQNGHFSKEETERICFLIAHHHTYDAVDGIDYRILIEADFLVNGYENHLDQNGILNMKQRIFRTETGKHLLDHTFGLEK